MNFSPGYLAFLLDVVRLVQERQHLANLDAPQSLVIQARHQAIDAALAPFEGSRP